MSLIQTSTALLPWIPLVSALGHNVNVPVSLIVKDVYDPSTGSTTHPAAAVVDLIANGRAAEFLQHDWHEPSTTYVGDLFDRLIGAGKYHESSLINRVVNWFIGAKESSKCSKEVKTSKIARAILSRPEGQNDNTTDCAPISQNEVSCLSVATGLDVIPDKEKICLYTSPVYYEVHASLNTNSFSATSPIYANIQACIQQWKTLCESNCLACISAIGGERTERIGSNTSISSFRSGYFDRTWTITINAPENILEFKRFFIQSTFKDVIIRLCEKKEFDDAHPMSLSSLFYMGFGFISIGTVAAVGIFGIKFYQLHRQRTAEEIKPLIPV